MNNWRELKLGEFTTQRKGINYHSENYSDRYTGHPFITIKCFSKGGGFTTNGLKHYTGPFTSGDILKPKEILFSVTDLTRAGDIVGSPLKVPDFGNKMPPIASMDCMRLIPQKDVCDSDFLYHRLMMPDVKSQMISYSAGSTVLHLDTKKTPEIKLVIPKNLREQIKIGIILDTIDQTIGKTETLIEKYQQIKQGLMHDLFTRGVTPDGKLRPAREQAPELYKETPIGWIPKGWDFTTCSSVCEKIIDCKNRTPPITPEGYPVIRTPNVRNGKFVDQELVFTDWESYKIWTQRGKPQIEDIVITREAPVGEVCMIPERHPTACLGQRMMLYRPNRDVIHPIFFLFALQSQPIQKRLDLISGGSTVGHVRVGDIRDLFVLKPKSMNEQKQIGSILESLRKKMDCEQNLLQKLEKQKSGLMHDLLTGKVSVTVDE